MRGLNFVVVFKVMFEDDSIKFIVNLIKFSSRIFIHIQKKYHIESMTIG